MVFCSPAWATHDVHQVIFDHGLMSIPGHHPQRGPTWRNCGRNLWMVRQFGTPFLSHDHGFYGVCVSSFGVFSKKAQEWDGWRFTKSNLWLTEPWFWPIAILHHPFNANLLLGLNKTLPYVYIYKAFQRDKNFKGGPALSWKCCEDFTWEWGTSDQFFEFDIYEPSRI